MVKMSKNNGFKTATEISPEMGKMSSGTVPGLLFYVDFIELA